MSRIWITGQGGMLGSRVAAEAVRRGHQVVATNHLQCPIDNIAAAINIVTTIKPDCIINCAGRTPPAAPLEMAMANTLGPQILASFKIRLVHMSTDCVFSGHPVREHVNQWYSPFDRPDPQDNYSRTKLAGEPLAGHVLVVRGSFVGPENGLLHWLCRQKGNIEGWLNAYWNGTSVVAMAKALVALAEGRAVGIVHVASSERAAKADLLRFFVQEWRLPVEVVGVESPWIDRCLESSELYQLPPLWDTMKELARERKECTA